MKGELLDALKGTVILVIFAVVTWQMIAQSIRLLRTLL